MSTATLSVRSARSSLDALSDAVALAALAVLTPLALALGVLLMLPGCLLIGARWLTILTGCYLAALAVMTCAFAIIGWRLIHAPARPRLSPRTLADVVCPPAAADMTAYQWDTTERFTATAAPAPEPEALPVVLPEPVPELETAPTPLALVNLPPAPLPEDPPAGFHPAPVDDTCPDCGAPAGLGTYRAGAGCDLCRAPLPPAPVQDTPPAPLAPPPVDPAPARDLTGLFVRKERQGACQGRSKGKVRVDYKPASEEDYATGNVLYRKIAGRWAPCRLRIC